MKAADLPFSSSDFLRLLEGLGLTGHWSWTFANDEQVWSPGLFRLLGLEADAIAPSYERLTQFVHPDDQACLESADDVRHEGLLGEHIVRVLRGDRSLRILNLRGTVFHMPDGRPRAAAGVVLDVTDREQMAAVLRMERRRQKALFEVLQSWSNSTLFVEGRRTASPEILTLTGVTRELFQTDCLRVVAPDDRARIRGQVPAMIAAGKSFEVSKRLIMADGDQGQFRFLYTPIHDAQGRTETWATYASRVGGPKAPMVDRVRKGLVDGIGGRHLRAGRALLGWSMQDLAEAGGLSFATVRRLEDHQGERRASSRAHNHERAVAALERAGIGFQLVEGNRVAVFKQ